MMKKLIFKIAKSLLFWAANWIYNYIDTDDDGKLSKDELIDLGKKIKELIKK